MRENTMAMGATDMENEKFESYMAEPHKMGNVFEQLAERERDMWMCELYKEIERDNHFYSVGWL
jgi:hypothetical protein